MKKYSNRALVLIISSLFVSLLSGCANNPKNLPSFDELLKSETQQDGKTCIRQNDINGYGVLGNDIISVDARGKKHYLITTLYRCSTLNTGFQAGFNGSYFDFCPLRDKIVTIDESCPVKSIFEFDSRDDAFAAFEKAKSLRDEAREAINTEDESKKEG